MGCIGSKHAGLEHVDDSVHVMLAHDKKAAQKKGKPDQGYVPRAEHPLLAQKAQQQQQQQAPDPPTEEA